jgi:flavin-dependent dehydrogenase
VNVTWTSAGETQSARARWFVDASGRDTFGGRTLQFSRDSLPIPKRIAVYAHFTGVSRNEGAAGGHICIVRLKDGWFWFIPIDAEKTSVGMVRTLDDMKEGGSDVSEWFARTVADSTDCRQRMEDATRVSQFYVTSDYTYRFTSLATERALLVGDAGGFIDPIFSSGVYIATRSGQEAARYILRAHAKGRALTSREQQRYTATVHRMMNIYLELIQAFYDNDAFEVFMSPGSRLNLLRTIASVLAGNTGRSFGMWWRMRFFYLVCHLQKSFPLVPRLNFADQAAKKPVHS